MTFAWAAGGLAAILSLLHLVSLALATPGCRRLRKPVPVPLDAPPVSVVRPLCGVDDFVAETLESGFRLDYPAYELIFDVASPSDPVIPLVRRLMDRYPAIPSRLIIGDEWVNANPKLNNCVKGWDAARHDWIVLSDHNVAMPRDFIQRMLIEARPDVGVVCATPIGERPGSFAAEIECAFLNSLQARWQYAGRKLGFGFVQGKNMLWRREVLDREGGIRALGAEIAEDAAATKILRRTGFKVGQTRSPFGQPLGHRSWRDVWLRQVRWARLRRVTFPTFFLPEILVGSVIPAIAGSYAVWHAGFSPTLFVLAFLALWYFAEALLIAAAGWPLSWRAILALVMRDIMNPALFASAWYGHDFVWRGNAMTVRSETKTQAG